MYTVKVEWEMRLERENEARKENWGLIMWAEQVIFRSLGFLPPVL